MEMVSAMKAYVRTVGHLCYGAMHGEFEGRWLGFVTIVIFDDVCLAWQLIESAWEQLKRDRHGGELWTDDRLAFDAVLMHHDAALAGHKTHCDKTLAHFGHGFFV